MLHVSKLMTMKIGPEKNLKDPPFKLSFFKIPSQ